MSRSTPLRRLALTLGILAFPLACAQLPGGFSMPNFAPMEASSESHASHSQRTQVTEEINGQPVGDDDDAPKKRGKKARDRGRDRDREDADAEEAEVDEAPRAKKKAAVGEDIGATCHKNDECSARACFVGAGDLGYCTKMCNSWSDCPSHWECKKPGNAPQRICMQDAD